MSPPQVPTAFHDELRAPSAPRGAMRARFLREVAALELPRAIPAARVIAEEALTTFPATVQRYLRFMGVVGKPRTWSVRLGWFGGFRMKPGQPWLRCEAWQYDTRLAPARVFKMRMWLAGVVPVVARDTYMRGRGHMLGKVLDVFPVADDAGEETVTGELVTYLNDAILLAPSLLLGPEATWSAVDEGSFDVALTNLGRTVTARVFVDERGAPIDFSTEDRFYQSPGDPSRRFVRTRWTTPVADWVVVDGRPIPTHGQAIWHLPVGPFAYADFRVLPGSFAFDVSPGE